jgi:hypothetical protein
MQFQVIPVRRAGRVQPRHVMWAGLVVGELRVSEVRDEETSRTLRVACIQDPAGQDLLRLLDATLVSVHRGWWTMTGWERVADPNLGGTLAYQQSWILIPVGEAEGSGSSAA